MKGISVQELGGIAMAFVLVAVIIAVAGTILSQIIQTQCTGGTAGYNSTTGSCVGAGGLVANTSTIASNATANGLTGLSTLGGWLPTIAVIVAAAVVIGIIVTYFRGQ